jgi:hypothetical protein
LHLNPFCSSLPLSSLPLYSLHLFVIRAFPFNSITVSFPLNRCRRPLRSAKFIAKMSTIQNLKNFIRHGKQARVVDPPRDHPTTNVSPVHAQQQKYQGYGISEPNPAHHQSQHHHAEHQVDEGYSVGALDNRNIVAQAGGAAAQAQGKQQKPQNVVREADIQQIVAEERERQGKLPRYPGLERYHLVEKMGDGAFSNVYRAKDTQQGGEVAIKVVRKFEMNSNQVRPDSRDHEFPFASPAFCRYYASHPPTLGSDIGRRSPPSGLQKAA